MPFFYLQPLSASSPFQDSLAASGLLTPYHDDFPAAKHLRTSAAAFGAEPDQISDATHPSFR